MRTLQEELVKVLDYQTANNTAFFKDAEEEVKVWEVLDKYQDKYPHIFFEDSSKYNNKAIF
jgi:hypothetical protein